MGQAPDNLIKEEPSAGGAGKFLVVEGVIGVPSGIGGDGAEEAFFDRDADGAPDRHLATHEERLEGVLGIEEAAPVMNRASGGETVHSRQHKGEQKSTAVVGLAVVSCGFQLDGFSHGVLEAREGVWGSRILDKRG